MENQNLKNEKPQLTPEQVAKKKKIQVTITVVVFSLLIAVIIYLLFFKDKDNNDKDTRPMVVTEDNVDDVINAMDKPVKDGYYDVTMSTKWVFDGNSSDAYVENSKSNTRTVYFDVNLSDTKELVYSSPYIPVGKKMKGFALKSKLAPGAYDAYVTYHLVDDNNKEVSSLSVNITFQVK